MRAWREGQMWITKSAVNFIELRRSDPGHQAFTTNNLSLVYEANQLNVKVICMSEHLIKPIHKPYLAIRPSKHPAGVVIAGQPYVHCPRTNGLRAGGLGLASLQEHWQAKPVSRVLTGS